MLEVWTSVGYGRFTITSGFTKFTTPTWFSTSWNYSQIFKNEIPEKLKIQAIVQKITKTCFEKK